GDDPIFGRVAGDGVRAQARENAGFQPRLRNNFGHDRAEHHQEPQNENQRDAPPITALHWVSLARGGAGRSRVKPLRSKRPPAGRKTVTVTSVSPGCHGRLVISRRNPPGNDSAGIPRTFGPPSFTRSIASWAYSTACDHSRAAPTSRWLPW